MKSFNQTLLIVLLIITCACSNKSSKVAEGTPVNEGVEYIADGGYCAEIEYYNPRTGTRSKYTLPVDVKNNKLTVIYFPNGGWLSSKHFIPPSIEKGKAKFVTDRGYHYSIKILYKGKCNYD